MKHANRREALSQMSGVVAGSLAAATLTSVSADDARAKPDKIKVGQIGVGHAHASKLSVYRASPDYEVVGVVEPDPTLRKRAASHAAYRGLPWLTQEQLLNAPGLQAVLVETRVRDLLTAAEACVSAGKHVHLDKPAGESLPHYKRILAEAARRKLLVQMGYMYRYNPAIIMLREFLERGWLGDVFEVHTVMSKVVPKGSRKVLAEYRGGLMFELGCHIIDLVIGVLGAPDSVTPYFRHSGVQDDNLIDNMLAILAYKRALATVKSTAMEVNGFERRHFVVCGTKGTFHVQPLDNPSARVALSEAREGYRAGYQDVTFPRYHRYVADAADMARIIRGEKETDFPYEHDLAVQATVLKACNLPLD